MQVEYPAVVPQYGMIAGAQVITIPAGSRGYIIAILAGTAIISTSLSTTTALPAGITDSSDATNLLDIVVTGVAGSSVYVRYNKQSSQV